ncbi:DnaJ- protein scj1 [Nowakowskiella sp. JEL0407]|nr:DnaJ- protein scj1 [Nowakowskiella sp. JEL0407]
MLLSGKISFLGVLLILLVILDLALAGKDYYKVLGVGRSATKRQIKKSYKELSKKYHPDKNKGDKSAEEKFIELAQAYEVLTDDEKRRIYDQYGEEGLNNQGQKFHDPFDIFSQFGFQGFGGHKPSERKGPEIRMELPVSLEELFLGKSFEVELNKQIICPTCRGSGAKNPDDVKTCTSCGGSGTKIVRQMLGPGIYQQMQTHCDACGGRGKIVKTTCKACGGHKVRRGSHQITVTIERGMQDGQTLLFEREGDQNPDITPGDVIFIISASPHPIFTRHGDNLYMKEVITLREALIGFERKIKHLDGEFITVKREGVTQPGELLFLYLNLEIGDQLLVGFVQEVEGEGMPNHEIPSERGKLYIEYQVVFPSVLTKQQQEKILRKPFLVSCNHKMHDNEQKQDCISSPFGVKSSGIPLCNTLCDVGEMQMKNLLFLFLCAFAALLDAQQTTGHQQQQQSPPAQSPPAQSPRFSPPAIFSPRRQSPAPDEPSPQVQPTRARAITTVAIVIPTGAVQDADGEWRVPGTLRVPIATAAAQAIDAPVATGTTSSANSVTTNTAVKKNTGPDVGKIVGFSFAGFGALILVGFLYKKFGGVVRRNISKKKAVKIALEHNKGDSMARRVRGGSLTWGRKNMNAKTIPPPVKAMDAKFNDEKSAAPPGYGYPPEKSRRPGPSGPPMQSPNPTRPPYPQSVYAPQYPPQYSPHPQSYYQPPPQQYGGNAQCYLAISQTLETSAQITTIPITTADTSTENDQIPELGRKKVVTSQTPPPQLAFITESPVPGRFKPERDTTFHNKTSTDVPLGSKNNASNFKFVLHDFVIVVAGIFIGVGVIILVIILLRIISRNKLKKAGFDYE